MRALALAAVLAASALAGNCIDRPCSAATNYAWDAAGALDTRPGTWGTAAVLETPYAFRSVPAGYRVRVLRVYGDVIAWAKGRAIDGTHAGVLWGLSSTASRDAHLVPAQDACMLYVQGAIDGARSVRLPFDLDVRAGGLLEADNTLVSKLAAWLNDTGLPVHIEATFTTVYQFEVAP